MTPPTYARVFVSSEVADSRGRLQAPPINLTSRATHRFLVFSAPKRTLRDYVVLIDRVDSLSPPNLGCSTSLARGDLATNPSSSWAFFHYFFVRGVGGGRILVEERQDIYRRALEIRTNHGSASHVSSTVEVGFIRDAPPEFSQTEKKTRSGIQTNHHPE